MASFRDPQKHQIVYPLAVGALLAVVILNLIPAALKADPQLAPLLIMLGLCLPWLVERILTLSGAWIFRLALLACSFSVGLSLGLSVNSISWVLAVALAAHIVPCSFFVCDSIAGLGAMLGVIIAGYLLGLSIDGNTAFMPSIFLVMVPFVAGILIFYVATHLARLGTASVWHAFSGTLVYCGIYMFVNF